MKAAIYARYSSDNQREESIEDQVRVCKDFALKNNLEVIDQYMFADEAQSGTLEHREALDALRAICKSGEVQAVIVDDSSRLSRDTRHFLDLMAEFDAYGVIFYSVSDGLSTADEDTRVVFQFRSIFNELYISDLSKKTRRGQEGQFLRGYIPSSIGYGYKLTKVGKMQVDNTGRIRAEGSKAEIIPEEAEVIIRIFTEFANGKAISAIVKDLNRELIPTRKLQQWNSSTVSKILENEIYIGEYTWGRYRTIKDPTTRKKKRIRNTKKPVLRRQDESLRVISDELWNRVQEQRKKKENMCPSKKGSKGFGKKQISYVESHPKHLLSHCLKCGECGGSVALIGGKGDGYYGCQNSYQRATCKNRKTISRKKLEDHFIAALFERVLVPEYLDSICTKVFDTVKAHFSHLPKELSKKKVELQKVQKAISTLIDFITKGDVSDAVRIALRENESRLTSLQSEIESLEKAHQDKLVRPSKDWIAMKVVELKELLSMRTEKSAMILREILGPVTLTPTKDENGKEYYTATTKIGTISLLGRSDDGSKSFLKWRWGELNPRPNYLS